MKVMNARVVNQIEDICREYGLSVDALTEELKKQKEKEEYELILASVVDSRNLVGRCFKGRCLFGGVSFENSVKAMFGMEMFFYRVVSEHAERIGEVECIAFSQTPEISFRAATHLFWQPSDGIVGHYYYSGIHNHSVSKHAIENLTEISVEEFKAAAKAHIDQLLETDWQAIAGSYQSRAFDNE